MKGIPIFLLAVAMAAQNTQSPSETATGSISGTVVESNTAAPLKDVEVYLNRSSQNSIKAVTDAQGRYTFRGIKPGRHRISAESPRATAYRIATLRAGQDLESVDLRIRNPGVITGKVLDENKEPLADIGVLLVAREYTLGALRHVYASMATTDDQGDYVLEGVTPGRAFLVMAQKRRLKLAPISEAPLDPKARKSIPDNTYYPGVDSADGADAIVLKPGERKEGLDIRMLRAPSRCLAGAVTAVGSARALRFSFEDRQATSGASGNGAMFVMPPGGLTGPDGKIRICDTTPGEYLLTLSPDYGDAALDFFGTAAISIGDRDIDRIVVDAKPTVELKGEVVWAGDPPEAPVTNQLSLSLQPLTRAQWRGETTFARVSIPGTFALKPVFIDQYQIRTFGLPEEIHIKDITYGGRSVLREPLAIGSATGEPTLKVLLARDGAVVNATVTDREGKLIPDTHVFLFPQAVASEAALAASVITGQTDQEGSWNSPRVEPGKYRIVASARPLDKSPESIARLWQIRMRAQELELKPNATAALKVPLESLE